METLTDLKPETVDGLKKLVRMNRDACEGFAAAADKVDNASLASAMREASDERARFASEMGSVLSINDAEILESGSALGDFHRFWINVRGAISGGDEQAMLSEALRGESALVDKYEEVLVEITGNPLNPVLHRHVAAVHTTRDNLERLREQYN